jgi:phosphoglycerate dehydrogenase-like enzyme
MYLILLSDFRDCGDLLLWHKNEREDFSSKKCLIVGNKGNIGSKVFEKCKSMGLQCKGFDVDSEESLEDLVRESDIVTLHCPLTKDTKECIKTEWLKDDVTLVNTARADLVNEKDLFNFLQPRMHATAAFDVYWEEPYHGDLLNLGNFIATPHVASMGKGFKKGLFEDLMNLLEK